MVGRPLEQDLDGGTFPQFEQPLAGPALDLLLVKHFLNLVPDLFEAGGLGDFPFISTY